MDAITSENITAAAVLAQFLILTIMVITSAIMGRLMELWVPFYRRNRQTGSYSLVLLVLTVITLGAFFFSDVFVSLWSPLFGNYRIPYISWSSAITVFFLMNIGCITLLVVTSGGARLSPFTPLYGVMPVLAIFLREPVAWIIGYVAFCMATFTFALVVGSHSERAEDGVRRHPFAFWFVTVATVGLATVIGIVTRPGGVAP